MRTTVDMVYARADWRADARYCLSQGWGYDNYENVFEWVKTLFEILAIAEKLEYTVDDVEEYARQVYEQMGTQWDDEK